MKNSEYIHEIREKLSQYLNTNAQDVKISNTAVARGVGLSGAVISQFLQDKYPGDNRKVAKTIDAWLKRQNERLAHADILTNTIETRAVKKVFQVARLCHIEGEMGVATGDAGIGKTRGIKYYAAQNPDVIMIEIFPGFTTRTLMSKLHKELGYNGTGTIFDMFSDVVDRLRGSGRLIIVDEAESLPYKGLELLRRLYDLSGTGILLVGMPELIANLRGNKGEYKQLYSRIAVHAQIPNMKESPEDIQALVASAIPGSNGLWKAFYSVTHNGRQLEKLLKRSIQVANHNGTDVTKEVVQNAKQYIII